ncbi:MAG: hypothetical protein QM493_09155 [Sulfurovum sp.]
MSRVYIDTREFSHPIPMEMAIEVIVSLDNDSYLYMLHTKKPIPLLDLAKTQRLESFYYEDSLGDWHILIAKNRTMDLSTLLLQNPPKKETD